MNAELFAEPAADAPPTPAPVEPAPCLDCAAWERNPLHGCLDTACDDCTARDIAKGPRAWASIKRGEKEPLRREIEHRFGDRALTVGRALVWKWCQRLQIAGPKT